MFYLLGWKNPELLQRPQHLRAQSGPQWGVRGSDLFQHVPWMLGLDLGNLEVRLTSGVVVLLLQGVPYIYIYYFFSKRMYIISPVGDEPSNVGRLKLRRSSSSSSRRTVAGFGARYWTARCWWAGRQLFPEVCDCACEAIWAFSRLKMH